MRTPTQIMRSMMIDQVSIDIRRDALNTQVDAHIKKLSEASKSSSHTYISRLTLELAEPDGDNPYRTFIWRYDVVKDNHQKISTANVLDVCISEILAAKTELDLIGLFL